MNSVLIRGGKVFDGDVDLGAADVLIRESRIEAVGPALDVPPDAEVVDALGCTVLPGLIDAHTHTFPDTLELAIKFGVTTELDLFSMPSYMRELRERAAASNTLADIRSASVCATVAGGHPTQMVGRVLHEDIPTLASVGDVDAFIEARIAEGADYIKLMIEDGSALGLPEIPTLSVELAAAVADAAHAHGLLALAHATSYQATVAALDAGVDGVTHLFIDAPISDDLVERAKERGAFFISSLSVMSAITGEGLGPELADDPRVVATLDPRWIENLKAPRPGGSSGRLQHALDAAVRLHEAGVRLLAGTDASLVGNAGSAHGVSMHGELRFLVAAGLSPLEALRAATSVTADVFDLEDRGRIALGKSADLLIVKGDPLLTIEDTLNIVQVRRRGELLERA